MLPKRLTWFGLGVATGAVGAAWGYVKAREVTTIDPDRVARTVVGAARGTGRHLRAVVDESRRGMAEAEAELRDDLARRRRATEPDDAPPDGAASAATASPRRRGRTRAGGPGRGR